MSSKSHLFGIDGGKFLQNTTGGPSGASATAASGDRRRLRVVPPPIKVTDLYFESGIDIWYARYPDPAVTYVRRPADALRRGAVNMFDPKRLPENTKPHWRKPYGASEPEVSWPAAFVRDGTSASPAPARALKVSFQAPNNFNATVTIKAVSSAGVSVAQKSVTFANGVAANISFTFDSLPTTIKWLNCLMLDWQVQTTSGGSFDTFDYTMNTLFILDWSPAAARTAGRGGENKYLFEIFDWACRWADGITGHNSVLDAIWGKFSPVRAAHDSGLVYWKNNVEYRVEPTHDLVSAIKSFSHPDEGRRAAASCIVFDLLLMNCLAVHGIKSAEIKIEPKDPDFDRSEVHYYDCSGFNVKERFGQGNRNGPLYFGDHWIADVVDFAGNWKIYDASYGAGPVDSDAPTGPTVNVLNYEPLAVRSFRCKYDIGAGVRSADIPPGSTPAIPPHIKGTVLSKN